MFFGGAAVGGERSFRVWVLGHGPHSKEEGEGRRRWGDCLIFPAEEVEGLGALREGGHFRAPASPWVLGAKLVPRTVASWGRG